MNRERFEQITGRYPDMKIAIVGDFCLDRYLEIDPARAEISIETGLPVYNVVRVRSQPGAAGTILNNLVALGLHDLDSVLLKIPIIGAFYETYLRQPSYYRDDTRRMYCTGVDRLVRAAVEKFADVTPGNAIDFKHDLVPTGLGF